MFRWVVILANVCLIGALAFFASVMFGLREELLAFGTFAAFISALSLIFAFLQGRTDTLSGSWIAMKKAQYQKKTRDLNEGS